MNSTEKSAFRAKYNRQQNIHDVPMKDAHDDINAILDDLPDSPERQKLRQKYDTGAARVMFWIIADDINALLDQVSPADDEGKAVTP